MNAKQIEKEAQTLSKYLLEIDTLLNDLERAGLEDTDEYRRLDAHHTCLWQALNDLHKEAYSRQITYSDANNVFVERIEDKATKTVYVFEKHVCERCCELCGKESKRKHMLAIILHMLVITKLHVCDGCHDALGGVDGIDLAGLCEAGFAKVVD